MKLGDHWDGGNQYLGVGWKTVCVTGYSRKSNPKTGYECIEFELEGEGGRIAKTRGFWLTEKAMMFLSDFAKACGITQEEAMRFDSDDARAPEIFVNRTVRVFIEKRDGKYHEAVEWSEEDGSAMPEPPKRPEPVAQAAAPTAERLDGIPF